MCGRYAVTLPPEAMRELFRTLNSIDYPPRYNIAPTQPILAILQRRGQRTMELLRWGLVPDWASDPQKFALLINARCESMADKPAFRDAVRFRRCIVPANGYYEWHTDADGKKQPYYVTMADGSLMAFAGLYATWSGPNGESIGSAAIVTTPAGPDTLHIHDRTPAVLLGEAVERWLETERVSAQEAVALAQPLPAGTVGLVPVSPAVGSNMAEGPELIEPVDPIEREEPTPRRKAAGQLELF